MFTLRADNEHGSHPTIINTKHIYDFKRKLIDQNSLQRCWNGWQSNKKKKNNQKSREANRECLIAVGWAFVLMKLSNLNVKSTPVVVALKLNCLHGHSLRMGMLVLRYCPLSGCINDVPNRNNYILMTRWFALIRDFYFYSAKKHPEPWTTYIFVKAKVWLKLVI